MKFLDRMRHFLARRRSIPLLMALLIAVAIAPARPHPALADTGVAPWSNPVPIASGLTQAARPSLVLTPDGVAHALWESAGRLYYSSRTPGQAWSEPAPVAYGISPALAVDVSGGVHALFANQFLGNHEIYHIMRVNGAWTLPVNVSHTSGFSASPVVAAGANGTLYAAWADNSPGYWTIYAGSWSGGYWSNYPIPHAQGQSPSIAVSKQGTVYVAWQDRRLYDGSATGTYTIYANQQTVSGWSLAINVSDRPGVDSIGASVTTTPDGLAHVAWVDGSREVRYAYGQGIYWSLPQTVVLAAASARGPRIITGTARPELHIAWDEGEVVRLTSAAEMAPSWPKPEVIPAQTGALRDVALTPARLGGLMVGWVQVLLPGNVGIYESRAEPPLVRPVWLPIASRQ